MSFDFKGSIAPVFTPFSSDGKTSVQLKLDVIPKYAKYLADAGVKGVLVNGTSGEGPSLTKDERKLAANAWADAVRSTGQHLMIQVGGAALPDVLELASHAERLKADSLLCLPDLYFKPSSPQRLVDYLSIVAAAAPRTPLLYYHIPGLTNVTVNVAELVELASRQIPTFSGVKFTSSNMDEAAAVLRACGNRCALFLGSDQIMLAACAMGITSSIMTSINIFPVLATSISEAFERGDLELARKQQETLTKKILEITKGGDSSTPFSAIRSWVETMKSAMNKLTPIDVGPPRRL